MIEECGGLIWFIILWLFCGSLTASYWHTTFGDFLKEHNLLIPLWILCLALGIVTMVPMGLLSIVLIISIAIC